MYVPFSVLLKHHPLARISRLYRRTRRIADFW
jgi:hypothetical protein